MSRRVRDNRPRAREWGDADQQSRDRVDRLTTGLSTGGPRDPTTFDELRAEFDEPEATDGEIHQAALDAGLVVEDE